MSLEKAKTGYEGIVKTITGESKIVSRLYELGFLPGEKISVKMKTLFNGPVVVEIQGISIALRQNEAVCIEV